MVPVLSSVLRLRSDVRYRMIEGEALVLRQEAAEVLGLNPVGSRVLELIDGQRSVSDLLRILEGEYEVERAELESDVLGFLGELLQDTALEEVAQNG